MTPGFRHWLVDTTERVIFTWIESFLGIVIVDAAEWTSLDVSTLEAAAISASISTLTVVKAAIASRRSGRDISPASFARGAESE